LLNSVFAELVDLPNTEVILADSASTDETVSIASTYSRVKILRLRKDQRLTPAAGRYVGFHHSSGELILHLDGDTELIPGWLRAVMELLQARPEIAGASGIVIGVPKDAQEHPAIDTLAHENCVRDVRHLRGCVSLYRRSILDQVGTFNPWLFAEEEAELALRIRDAGYCLVEIQQPAVFHRSDEQSMTFSALAARWQRDFLFAQGQILRNLCGSRLFWKYARERSYAFLPASVLLAGLGAIAVSVVTKDWRWLGSFLIVAICLTAALVVYKRSLYDTAVWLFARILVLIGTIRGVLIETPAPNTYRVNSEEFIHD
jgi:glycosyltransferase involved in cell wall biosynthesis